MNEEDNERLEALLELNEMKEITGRILYSTLAHFIDCHATSEHNQELLQLFADSVAEGLESIDVEFVDE
jgi:hypothetical protein